MKHSKHRKQAWLDAFCSFTLAGVLAYLLISKRYRELVTERLTKYLYLSIFVLLLWTVFSLIKKRKPSRKLQLKSVYLFLLPAIILVLPHPPLTFANQENALSAVAKQDQGQNAKDFLEKKGKEDEKKKESDLEDVSITEVKEKDLPDQTGNTESGDSLVLPSDQGGKIDPSKLKEGEIVVETIQGFQKIIGGLDEKKKRIDITQDQYYLWLTEIFKHPKKYEGYTIHLTGFVFHFDQFQNDWFMLSRYLMTCCIADVVPAGIIAYSPEGTSFNQDDWLDVEGVIEVKKLTENEEPVLKLTKVEKTEVPEDPYVYPY